MSAPRYSYTLIEIYRAPDWQFNSYDFDKIHSHAGVRSDLYPRPLDRSLLTDFFGGIAQVEVLSPDSLHTTPATCLPIEDKPALTSVPVASPSQLSWAPTRPVSRTQIAEILTVWGANPTARAWSSLALVGSLVAWVFIGKK